MTHLGTTTIESERLTLRRFEAGDSGAMFRNWARDPEVTKFLMWQAHERPAVSEAIIGEWLPLYEQENYYNWAIVLKSLGEPIGSIGVVAARDDIKMVHIGYCIGQAWWGQGIVSEALAALVRFFFLEVGVNRVESRHDPENPASGRVMQKCGLRYEGTLRQRDTSNRGLCDAAYYAILSDDYEEALS